MDPELKKLIDQMQAAFEDFKKANDARLAQIEKRGAADAVTEEQVNKLNAEITRLSAEIKAAQARADEIERKANRPALIVDPARAAGELKAFNLALQSHARRLGRNPPSALDHAGYEAYKAAFNVWARRGDRDLNPDESKALTVGSDPEGGYLCPPEIEAGIDRIVSSMGAMRSAARVIVIGAASYKKVVNKGGAAAGGWAGETGAPSETATPTLAELEFTPGRLWAEPRATSDNLEDSVFDAEGWLADEVGITFAEQEGQAFVDGSGVNRPRGVLAYGIVANASYEWGKLGYVASGAAGAFAASNPSDKLIDLQHALRRPYRPGASWMMNDGTLATIRKLKDGQGNYLWKPGLQGGIVFELLGHPVNVDDFWPAVAADSYSIGFGNWQRGYVIVDRRGTVVLRDPYTAKPYVKFYTTRRTGGGVQNFEAIKLMKFAAS